MIKPMLAHKVNDKRIDFSEPVFIQPKLDGVRCIFTKDGAYSRTGKQFHNLRKRNVDIADNCTNCGSEALKSQTALQTARARR